MLLPDGKIRQPPAHGSTDKYCLNSSAADLLQEFTSSFKKTFSISILSIWCEIHYACIVSFILYPPFFTISFVLVCFVFSYNNCESSFRCFSVPAVVLHCKCIIVFSLANKSVLIGWQLRQFKQRVFHCARLHTNIMHICNNQQNKLSGVSHAADYVLNCVCLHVYV